jgi:vacuolar-type H+-ATPase subunit F/Vma7
MSRVVAIGDARRLGGYALAGVDVVDASTGAAADVFAGLGEEVGLIVLTEEAYEALGGEPADQNHLVWVVVPG